MLIFEQHEIKIKETLTVPVLNMTYLASKYIDACSRTAVGTRNAKNRGQKVGHVVKMYNFRGAFCSFLNGITLTYIYTFTKLNMTLLGSNR